ncbi:MAG: phosphonate C-P lyase system protein PhnH [Rhodospirillaceae bacterium]
MPASSLAPGLADPVLDSQAVFRAVLDALSRPGTLVPLTALPPAPAPLYTTTGAVVLSLADLDAPVFLDPPLATQAVAAWLRFHAGCAVAPREAAAFALIGAPQALISLDDFALGTSEFPDRSTTLVVQVPAVQTGEGRTLTGPGIKTTTRLSVDGLPDAFWTAWRDNHALFPQGVDVIFATPTCLCGLPRTTRVED